VRPAGEPGRRGGSPTRSKPSDDDDRALAEALQRHWGNLF
jgi:hypothetical protein